MAEFVKINVTPEGRDKLNALSKKFDRRGYQIFEQAMDYFRETGYDPESKDFDLPAAELKKLRNSLVSFLRKMEKDTWLPMAGQVQEMMVSMAQFMAESNSEVFSSKDKKSEKKDTKGFYMPGAKESDESAEALKKEKIARERLQIEKDVVVRNLERLEANATFKNGKYTIVLDEAEFQALIRVR